MFHYHILISRSLLHTGCLFISSPVDQSIGVARLRLLLMMLLAFLLHVHFSLSFSYCQVIYASFKSTFQNKAVHFSRNPNDAFTLTRFVCARLFFLSVFRTRIDSNQENEQLFTPTACNCIRCICYTYTQTHIILHNFNWNWDSFTIYWRCWWCWC